MVEINTSFISPVVIPRKFVMGVTKMRTNTVQIIGKMAESKVTCISVERKTGPL